MALLGQVANRVPAATTLKEKLEARVALVAVVGAGYVGLPLAVQTARAGFPVVCLDLSAERVRLLGEGRNYIADVSDHELATLVSEGRIRATADFAVLRQADVVIVCVPTPLTENREPDLTHVQNVAGAIGSRLRPGQLISLESTTYPGTTEELFLPALSADGLKAGTDFFLCFSPERVDPGNPRYGTNNTPKVIGGVTPTCLDVGVAFYATIVNQVIPVSSPRVAEMAKLFENTYRAVNIALVNELAMLCDRMDLDVWEVIEAAATKPFGIQTFWPGPGVGGHCIPLDPFYLTWKAREFDFPTRFIELAGEINLRMAQFVKEKLARALGEAGKPLHGSTILVLGVAYKRNVADERESPALRVIQLLQRDGAQVLYHDPFVPTIRPQGRFKAQMDSVPLRESLWATLDAVVITTDHFGVDYQEVARKAPLVIDTRNAMKSVQPGRARIVKL